MGAPSGEIRTRPRRCLAAQTKRDRSFDRRRHASRRAPVSCRVFQDGRRAAGELQAMSHTLLSGRTGRTKRQFGGDGDCRPCQMDDQGKARAFHQHRGTRTMATGSSQPSADRRRGQRGRPPRSRRPVHRRDRLGPRADRRDSRPEDRRTRAPRCCGRAPRRIGGPGIGSTWPWRSNVPRRRSGRISGSGWPPRGPRCRRGPACDRRPACSAATRRGR